MQTLSLIYRLIPSGLIILLAAVLVSLGFNGDNFDISSVSALLVLLWVLFLTTKIRGDVHLNLSISTLTLVALFAWLLISDSLSISPGLAFLESWPMLMAIGVALAISQRTVTERTPKEYDALFIILAFIIAGWTLFEAIALADTYDGSGFFINPNSNAAVLNLLFLVLAARLITYAKPSKESYMTWIAAILGLVLIAYTSMMPESRGVFFSALIGLILLGVLTTRVIHPMRAWLPLGLYLATFFVYAAVSKGAFFQALGTMGDLESASLSRLVIWESSWQMLQDTPWYGIGMGLFWLIYPQYRSIEDHSAGVFVHNDYLQLAIEIGYPGLILLGVLFLSVTWGAWKVRTSAKLTAEEKTYVAGLLSALVAVAAHSFLTFNFYLLPTLLLIGMIVGLLAQYGHRVSMPPARPITWRTSKAIPALITVIVLAYPTWQIAKAGWAYSSAERAKSETEALQRRSELIDRAIALDPDFGLYRAYKAAWIARDLSETHDRAAREAMFTEARGLFKEARRLNPFRQFAYNQEILMLVRHPDLAGEAGLKDALGLAKAAIVLNPRNLISNRALAMSLAASAHSQEALNHLLNYFHKPYRQNWTAFGTLQYARDLASKYNDKKALSELDDIARDIGLQ